MKAKHLLTIMLAIFLASAKAVAQPAIEMFCTSNKTYINDAKNRTWIVELLEEDQQIIKQIGKKDPAGLEKYKASIQSANEVLKKVVAENWTITPATPEFKTKQEVQELTKGADKDKYALLWINRFMAAQPSAPANAKNAKPQPLKEEAILSMRLAGNVYRHIGAVNLPNANPNETEFLVALQLLQNHFLIRQNSESLTAFEDDIKENAPVLKEKTLLVPKHALKKGMTLEQLKSVYPYEIKITDQAEIEKAIAERDASICFIQTLPAYGGTKPVNMQLVIDAANGRLLARSVPPTFSKGVVKNELRAEHFKDFLQFAASEQK